MIPTHAAAAAGAATILGEIKFENGAAKTAETIWLGRCGSDLPTGHGARGPGGGAMAQQKAEVPADADRQRQPTSCSEIGSRARFGQFGNDRAQRSGFQRLL